MLKKTQEESKNKIVSAYLGQSAIKNLDNIRQFYKNLGIEVSDSAIITNAISSHYWFLYNITADFDICPNASCNAKLEEKKDGMLPDKCPSCDTALLWIPVADPWPSLEAVAKKMMDRKNLKGDVRK